MTYLQHDYGKHYTEITGPDWAVVLYRLTGRAWWKLKMKPKYRGK